MQNSNVAIPASNTDIFLLDSLSYWRQFGYFCNISVDAIFPRQRMDMLVETDYIRQGFLTNE